MKRLLNGLLVLALVLGGHCPALAVDLLVRGEMWFGAGFLDSSFVDEINGRRLDVATADRFTAMQRWRMQLEARVSEALSGLVCFEVGDNVWGSDNTFGGGASLGTDGTVIKVRHAYVDWTPNVDLRVRMGLQTVPMPYTAGGSSVMNNEMAAIMASYSFNDTVGLTVGWMRPFNNNFYTADGAYRDHDGAYDNLDLFTVSVPVVGDGWKVTPWVLGGVIGKNVFLGDVDVFNYKNTLPYMNIPPYTLQSAVASGTLGKVYTDRNYGRLFFAGLPVVLSAFDPLNIEIDINYGYSQGFGRFETRDWSTGGTTLASDRRAGWLIKGLAEYKLDWGTPGLMAWYASGDDGNARNGSERMPAISPCGNFTSFVGDDPTGFGMLMNGAHTSFDLQLNYAGTWGLGVQLKDISVVPDLSHTLRIVRWAGTNSPSLLKHLSPSDFGEMRMTYLTTKDAMIEFNFDSVYRFTDALSAHIQFGYVINQVNTDAWTRWHTNTDMTKKNAYKASAQLYYQF